MREDAVEVIRKIVNEMDSCLPIDANIRYQRVPDVQEVEMWRNDLKRIIDDEDPVLADIDGPNGSPAGVEYRRPPASIPGDDTIVVDHKKATVGQAPYPGMWVDDE